MPKTVINPKTGRKIKVGGETYNKLKKLKSMRRSARKSLNKKSKRVTIKTPPRSSRKRTLPRRSSTSFQPTKKYLDRPSPPYKANEHCGKVKTGNDGRAWISTPDVRGICRWQLLK